MTASEPFDLVVRSRRVVLPDGERPAAVGVSAGRIAAVLPYTAAVPTVRDEDAGALALLPGLVDTHVHVNEPGRTHWEGFDTATRAAARGGVTTIVDMPLNSLPPTLNVAALGTKRAAAAGRCHVDVGFWGGAVPGNAADLPGLHESGVFGFKCFLADSGVPEFPHLSAGGLATAARATARLGSVLLIHAESAVVLDGALRSAPVGRRYREFLASRPDDAEVAAVEEVVAAVRRTGTRAHILHVSSAAVLPRLAAARAEGLPVTAETCPHYLFFAADEIPDGATEFKCCPPIRDAANRELLWQALDDGVLDMVVSDHSPSEPALKLRHSGDFGAAWGGIASLQLSLPAVWTRARARGWTLGRLAHAMATAPADLAGLRHKGRIGVGADADLLVFDPEETSRVDGAALAHRHPLTPYQGATLAGAVRKTYLRGRPVDGHEARGRTLSRLDAERAGGR